MGGSGQGKTVFLKLLLGVLSPDSGRVMFKDQDVCEMGTEELIKMRSRIGMLFQGAALFDSLTVKENVAYPIREHFDYSEDEITRIVAEKLSLVGLEGIETMMPVDLSGGMKKRVGLARAISMWPKIILFDEPTTGVDPIMGDIINNFIRYLHGKLKVTSITVTHDMSSAYRVADRICIFYKKKLIDIGTPEDVQRSEDPVVKQFVTGAAHGPLTEDGEK